MRILQTSANPGREQSAPRRDLTVDLEEERQAVKSELTLGFQCVYRCVSAAIRRAGRTRGIVLGVTLTLLVGITCLTGRCSQSIERIALAVGRHPAFGETVSVAYKAESRWMLSFENIVVRDAAMAIDRCAGNLQLAFFPSVQIGNGNYAGRGASRPKYIGAQGQIGRRIGENGSEREFAHADTKPEFDVVGRRPAEIFDCYAYLAIGRSRDIENLGAVHMDVCPKFVLSQFSILPIRFNSGFRSGRGGVGTLLRSFGSNAGLSQCLSSELCLLSSGIEQTERDGSIQNGNNENAPISNRGPLIPFLMRASFVLRRWLG